MLQALYVNRGSPVHSLDPRTKIIGLLALSALPFVFNHPGYVAVIAVGVVATAVVGGCQANLARFRYLYLLFFGVNFVLWQFYIPGVAVVARLGPVVLTREALLYGLAAATRFVVVLMVGTLFVSCTSTEDLTVGLVHLRLPYSVAFVVSTTVRLVPTFVATAGQVMEAQAARGFAADSRNPVTRVRQLLPITIPLIMYTLRYASLLSLALEARGFNPRVRRTSFAEPILRPTDLVVLLALVLILSGALALRLTGHGAVQPGRI